MIKNYNKFLIIEEFVGRLFFKNVRMFSLIHFLIMSNLCMDHSDPLLLPPLPTAPHVPCCCFATRVFGLTGILLLRPFLGTNSAPEKYPIVCLLSSSLRKDSLTQQTVVNGCSPYIHVCWYSVSFIWSPVSSLLSITVINAMAKSSLGGKGSSHHKGHCPSSREAKAGTQGWNHGGMVLTDLLLLACLAAFLIQPKPACPSPQRTGCSCIY